MPSRALSSGSISSWPSGEEDHHVDARSLKRALARLLPSLRRLAHGRLPAWARSTVDTADVVHDALARTLARLDAFQPQGRRALGAYLRQAVRNRIRDEHRRRARRGIPEEISEHLADHGASPLEHAMASETGRRYRAALARLPRRDRELIVAHVELGYSHEQLGCMTGRSPNAARMALCRAIDRLAAHMRRG